MLRSSRILFLLVTATGFAGPIPITAFDLPLTENFNVLAAATTGTHALPAGWTWGFLESGSAANSTYAASTGSSATGNTYSFGATASSERAFGMLRTASLSSVIGASFLNQLAQPILKLELAYTGEQWRLGARPRADRLDFAYSLDATSLVTGSWTDVDAFDFITPNLTAALGALDGNAPLNQTFLASSITGLSISPGSTFWLRWTDFDAPGSDDGLAIDNVSLWAPAPPPPPAPPPLIAPPIANVPDGSPLGALVVTLGMLIGCSRRRGR